MIAKSRKHGKHEGEHMPIGKKTHGTKMDQILRIYGKNKHGKDGKTWETLRENKNTWAKMEKHSMGNIRNMKNMWGIEHRTQLSWGLNE